MMMCIELIVVGIIYH